MLAGLIGAAPAAADVPYEKRWERAVDKARFAAAPAPGELAGLRPERYNGGDPAIHGRYDTWKPDEPACRAVTDRFVFRQTTGTFHRGRDGAWMFLSFFNKVPKGCESPAPDDLPGTKVLGRVTALGERLKLDTFPLPRRQVAYRVQGRLRGHRLSLQINYPRSGDPGPAEFEQIVGSLRWVKRP